ncbi:MAG: M14 family metallopeptidase [Chitinophagales bacterium]
MLQPDQHGNEMLTPFEKGNGNQTCTYDECIAWYQSLDKKFEEVQVLTYGNTSVGKPLHLVVISKDKIFKPEEIRKNNKRIYLINNGIHPGEPDGIDASMMLARDLLLKKELNVILDHVVIIIIPVYNVSGMLNRGSSSRVNQNGPEEYGFRGTAQNYDLNRDFVKCDSKEAQTFTQIFREWQPEIFVDTHVSNGADYQYTMTLIPSQPDKLQPVLAAYQEKIMLPDLNVAMKNAGFEMIPYVNTLGESPDSGLVQFLETARYSTGYAALFNCIGMMPETHMLKEYAPRVRSTYSLLEQVGKIVNRDYEQIGINKKKADEAVASLKEFALNWILDEKKFTSISFKGYAAKHKLSEVSGLQRLYYNRNEPFEKEIKYFNHYETGDIVATPLAYIIPQGWENVTDRLKWNGVAMKRLAKDTSLDVTVYYIEDFKTGDRAFEGHFLHANVKVRSEVQQLQYYKGDYVIFPNQPSNRYIVEMLEPQGADSYFAWNFFDPILMEKEYFSDYVFEDLAAEMLQKDASLKATLEKRKENDPDFAKSAEAQLNFVYTHSRYYEKSYRRYPVGRVINGTKIPLD